MELFDHGELTNLYAVFPGQLSASKNETSKTKFKTTFNIPY